MSLVLNEEQKMLKTSAKEFLDNKFPLSNFRKYRDNDFKSLDFDLWTEMAEMGWTALIIPEKYNGLNFGYVGLGQVIEEMGKRLTVCPIMSTVLISTSVISSSKNEFLKSKLFSGIMNGSVLICLAHEEGNQHHPENIQTSLRRENGNLILNGKKNFVIDANISDYLIVSAKEISSSNTILVLVEKNQKGVSVNSKTLMDSRSYSEIIFKNVEIKNDYLLSNKDDGKNILEKVFEIARIGYAAEMLGGIQQAFDMTMSYLKTREQFGVKIGSFQSLQHRSALMFAEIELCKSIVLKALQSIDAGEELSKNASLAKAKLGLTYKLISNEAIQMHGGIGVTDDSDVGFFLKRSRVIEKAFGDSNFHLDRLSKIGGY